MYRHVLGHSNKLGINLVTCPYYEELDRIFKGDPSLKSKRVSQSMKRDNVPRVPARRLEDLTIDLFSLNTKESAVIEEAAHSSVKTSWAVYLVMSHRIGGGFLCLAT